MTPDRTTALEELLRRTVIELTKKDDDSPAAVESYLDLIRECDAILTTTEPTPVAETWRAHVFQPGASAPDRCLWTDGRWSACKAPADAWCHIPVCQPTPPTEATR